MSADAAQSATERPHPSTRLSSTYWAWPRLVDRPRPVRPSARRSTVESILCSECSDTETLPAEDKHDHPPQDSTPIDEHAESTAEPQVEELESPSTNQGKRTAFNEELPPASPDPIQKQFQLAGKSSARVLERSEAGSQTAPALPDGADNGSSPEAHEGAGVTMKPAEPKDAANATGPSSRNLDQFDAKSLLQPATSIQICPPLPDIQPKFNPTNQTPRIFVIRATEDLTDDPMTMLKAETESRRVPDPPFPSPKIDQLPENFITPLSAGRVLEICNAMTTPIVSESRNSAGESPGVLNPDQPRRRKRRGRRLLRQSRRVLLRSRVLELLLGRELSRKTKVALKKRAQGSDVEMRSPEIGSEVMV